MRCWEFASSSFLCNDFFFLKKDLGNQTCEFPFLRTLNLWVLEFMHTKVPKTQHMAITTVVYTADTWELEKSIVRKDQSPNFFG